MTLFCGFVGSTVPIIFPWISRYAPTEPKVAALKADPVNVIWMFVTRASALDRLNRNATAHATLEQKPARDHAPVSVTGMPSPPLLISDLRAASFHNCKAHDRFALASSLRPRGDRRRKDRRRRASPAAHRSRADRRRATRLRRETLHPNAHPGSRLRRAAHSATRPHVGSPRADLPATAPRHRAARRSCPRPAGKPPAAPP